MRSRYTRFHPRQSTGLSNNSPLSLTALFFELPHAVWSEVIVGVDPDPANAKAISDWARGYYDALHPFGAGGAYMNFMMEEGEDRIRATYRGNYDRLAAVKAKYDPGNFFNVNQNIRPAPQQTAA